MKCVPCKVRDDYRIQNSELLTALKRTIEDLEMADSLDYAALNRLKERAEGLKRRINALRSEHTIHRIEHGC